MITAIASNSLLLQTADQVYPSSGTIGHVILLRDDLISAAVTPNTSIGYFNVPPGSGFLSGMRVRISSTGSLPAPFVLGDDYWVVDYGSNRIFLASDAQGTNAISVSSAGSGTITITEQLLTAEDSLDVLLSKELASGGAYQRLPLAGLGAAAIVAATDSADKPPKTVQIENTGATAIGYRHILVGIGANNIIGDPSGITGFLLATESAPQSILPGETRIIVVTLQAVRVP
jgi:hypothetical protein